MTIPLLTIAALATELGKRLAGEKILAVRTLARDGGLCLDVATKDQRPSLCLPTGPTHFVPFLCPRPALCQEHSGLAKSLEHHLQGHTIRAVEQWRGDRMLRVEFQRSDEVRGLLRRALVAELVPRRQNIILLDSDRDLVLAALRRVDGRISRIRQVLPGKSYQPPPAPPGYMPGVQSLGDFQNAFRSVTEGPLAEVLGRLLPWAWPYLIQEICRIEKISLPPKAPQTTDRQLETIWNHLERWIGQMPATAPQPTLIYDSEGQPDQLLSFNPLSLPRSQKRSFETFSQALEMLYEQESARSHLEDERNDLLAELHRALRRHRRAVKHLQRDLGSAQRAEEYKRKGQILVSQLSRLRRGMAVVKLPDPYSSTGQQVEIALDPKLSPSENAQRYFQRHRKARASRPKVHSRLRQLGRQLEVLEALRDDVKAATQPEDIAALKSSLPQPGLSAPSPSLRPSLRTAAAATQPLSFALPEGWKALVGRNNKQNDLLTHRMSKPDDLWFHAQGVPGSHLVLPRSGRKDNPSKRVMELAAGLAAHFSRARHSGTVPVIYTEKRYVRKPKGAKPGLVAVERERTLFVKPLSPKELPEDKEK